MSCSPTVITRIPTRAPPEIARPSPDSPGSTRRNIPARWRPSHRRAISNSRARPRWSSGTSLTDRSPASIPSTGRTAAGAPGTRSTAVEGEVLVGQARAHPSVEGGDRERMVDLVLGASPSARFALSLGGVKYACWTCCSARTRSRPGSVMSKPPRGAAAAQRHRRLAGDGIG
jgi:hypothetical protein